MELYNLYTSIVQYWSAQTVQCSAIRKAKAAAYCLLQCTGKTKFRHLARHQQILRNYLFTIILDTPNAPRSTRVIIIRSGFQVKIPCLTAPTSEGLY
jgi:hypothetical protein